MRKQTKMLIVAFTICACAAFLITGGGLGDSEASDDTPYLNAELFLTGPDSGMMYTSASVAGTVYYEYRTVKPAQTEFIDPPVPDTMTWDSFTVSEGDDYTEFTIPYGSDGLWISLWDGSSFSTALYVQIPLHHLIAEPDELVGGGTVTFTSDIGLEEVLGMRQTLGEGGPNDVEATGSGKEWSITLPNEAATYIFNGSYKVDVDGDVSTGQVSCVVFVAHVHQPSLSWSSDTDGHWHQCICGERVDGGPHTSNGVATMERAETCIVCGYEIAPKLTGYTVTLKANGGSDDPDVVIEGILDGYTLPDNPFTPRLNHVFQGWSRDPNGPTIGNSVDVIEDTTYYAIWNIGLSYGSLTYDEIDRWSVEVTGFIPGMRQDFVDIPSEIIVDGRAYDVVGVTIEAFKNDTLISEVTIAEGVGYIGDDAFYGCTGILELDLSPGIETLGHSAFRDCTSLREIVLPDGLVVIGESAFQGCTGLTSVYIPSSVTNYSSGAFEGCTSLISVEFADGSTTIGEGMFKGCTKLRRIDLPSSITFIGMSAFEDCTNLNWIRMPSDLECIRGYAFKNCLSLTSISLPSGITEMGSSIFEGCTKLHDVKLNDLEVLGNSMFNRCTALVSIDIPSGVTTLPPDVFNSCTNLRDVHLPEGLISIGRSAFGECTNLMGIDIPSTVTDIDGSVFYGCERLEEVTLPPGISNVAGSLFDGCYSLDGMIIPYGITSIGISAFRNCSGISEIVIPPTVTSIGVYAFEGNMGHLSVTIQYYDELPSYDEDSFDTTDITYEKLLRPPSDPRWDGYEAIWSGVDGATYEVQLTDRDGNVVETVTIDTTSYDFSDRELVGHFGFEVTALKDGLRSATMSCIEKRYFREGTLDFGGDTTGIIQGDTLVVGGDDPLNGKVIDASDTEVDWVLIIRDLVDGSAGGSGTTDVIMPGNASVGIGGAGWTALDGQLTDTESLVCKAQEVDLTDLEIQGGPEDEQERPLMVMGGIEIDFVAVDASGATRGLKVTGGDFTYSTSISLTKDQNPDRVRGYLLNEDGTLEDRETTVTINGDGTYTVTATSKSNSIYVFIYDEDAEPAPGDAGDGDNGNNLLWIGIGAVIAIVAIIGVAMVARSRA